MFTSFRRASREGSWRSETLTSSDLDAGMCWGGTERSGEQSAPETAPMGKIPLPDRTGNGNMLRRGEKGLWPQRHLTCRLLQPVPGPAGGKNDEVRFDFFNPLNSTKFWRAGTRQGEVGETKMNK